MIKLRIVQNKFDSEQNLAFAVQHIVRPVASSGADASLKNSFKRFLLK